jgi:TolA-binding protein
MPHRFFMLSLLASAVLYAQKPTREIQELQRDVAQLQDEVRQLKQALEQRIAASATQVEAMAKAFEPIRTGVASLQTAVADQQTKIVPIIAAQGSKVDQVNSSLATMQQAFADLTASVNRLQTQLTDLGNAVKVITTPAPRPPSAEELLKSADADRLGGKYELAAQGYADYLRTYADSPQADIAQFQLGMAHYQMKELESALNDFDAVARNHPKSSKVPDALFYKAKALQALDRASDATAACSELRRKFPRNEFVAQCAAPRR